MSRIDTLLLEHPDFDAACVTHWRGWLRREALSENEAIELRDEAFAIWDGIRTETGATREQIQAANRQRVYRLAQMPYRQYLQTAHWRMVREEALAYGWHACCICLSDGPLNVHHRTYERRGHELLRDLTVLCADCHGLFHRERKLRF